MCGITGALDLTGLRTFSHKRLLAMTETIAHRGPDDEHFHIEPGLAMGARRLAIIDVKSGRQPIANESNNIWAAFNGELFDYPDIRKQLLTRGHHLKTNCDTEAWVHLYEDYSEAMFDHAKGQFAVSLWDSVNQKLILGRDRVGICPLYYTISNGWLLWASEIKALLASGLVVAKPDLKGIDHLFNFFCAGTIRSFFEGIQLIPPGHFLRVKDRQIEIKQYWDLEFPHAGEEREAADPRQLVDEFEEILTTAVARRLRSDVPVVSYISGGLDSNLILELSGRHRGNPIPSFTIGMDKSAGPDERKRSIASASLLKSDLTSMPMNLSKIAHSFPEFILATEGPVLDTSCAALMQLAALVHEKGYKVVLSGEGADEALAGYNWFKLQKISRMLGLKTTKVIWKMIHAAIGRKRKSGLEIADDGIRGIWPAQQFMYESLGLLRGSLYSDHMWDSLSDHDPFSDLDLPSENLKHWHPLNQSLYVGYKTMLPGLLMISKGDRIAMHSSVETRYPYLDEDVIEFCANISPKYKLKGMTEKWLLRQVAAKSLPQKIANRRKTSFRARLFQTFLGSHKPAWVDQLLSYESLQKTGYFNANTIVREYAKQGRPRLTPRQFAYDATLTSVLSTQLWHHLFFGGGLCDLPDWKPTTINDD